jgi:hypothetical protein
MQLNNVMHGVECHLCGILFQRSCSRGKGARTAGHWWMIESEQLRAVGRNFRLGNPLGRLSQPLQYAGQLAQLWASQLWFSFMLSLMSGCSTGIRSMDYIRKTSGTSFFLFQSCPNYVYRWLKSVFIWTVA